MKCNSKRRNKDIRIGDKVRVKRDIFRLPNPINKTEKDLRTVGRRIAWLDSQDMILPPEACYTLYAQEGEEGTVVENFGKEPAYLSPAYLFVLMDDGTKKTFRHTSLERI